MLKLLPGATVMVPVPASTAFHDKVDVNVMLLKCHSLEARMMELPSVTEIDPGESSSIALRMVDSVALEKECDMPVMLRMLLSDTDSRPDPPPHVRMLIPPPTLE